jgi:hypothetical protein
MQKDLIPVFAEFGGAVHMAQRLEFGLELLLAFAAKYDQAQFTKSIVNRLSSKDAEKTLGELFHGVKESEYLTRAEKKIIRKAIKERNVLVHSYLIDKGELLLTPDGRAEVVKDIGRIQKNIIRADGIIESLIDRYLLEYDTNIDEIMEQWDTLLVDDDGDE